MEFNTTFMEPVTKIPESNAATETGGVSNSASADYTPALVTLTSVFFIWGFMTVMNDILIPHLKSIFDLKYYQSMLVQTAFFGAYFIGSVVYFLISSRSGDPINKIGYMVLAALAAFLVIYIANYVKSDMAIVTVLPLLVFVAIAFILFVAAKSFPSKTLCYFASTVILLLLITIFFTGDVAFWSVIGIGLFNAIMWSNIFTLSIDGLGKYTSQGSSLLVMMILGGAIIPPVQGLVADVYGVQASFVVPAFCYLYLVYFGLIGYKIRKTEL